MSDNDSELSAGMNLSGDAAPTATDPCSNDVLNARQQSILNELRKDLCYNDLKYLDEHKEVEAIATLVLKELLKNTPKNPGAHAARYLRDPRTLDSINKFSKSRSSIARDLLDRDAMIYATTTAMMAEAQTDHESGQSEEQNKEENHEQNEEQNEKQDKEQNDEQDEKWIESSPVNL